MRHTVNIWIVQVRLILHTSVGAFWLQCDESDCSVAAGQLLQDLKTSMRVKEEKPPALSEPSESVSQHKRHLFLSFLLHKQVQTSIGLCYTTKEFFKLTQQQCLFKGKGSLGHSKEYTHSVQLQTISLRVTFHL